MAGRIVRSPLVADDLFGIWAFIATDNPGAADRQLDRIGDVLQSLADNPLMARARPELGEDLRSFPVGAYVVFFRPLPGGVHVVRILSGYMDITPGHFA